MILRGKVAGNQRKQRLHVGWPIGKRFEVVLGRMGEEVPWSGTGGRSGRGCGEGAGLRVHCGQKANSENGAVWERKLWGEGRDGK